MRAELERDAAREYAAAIELELERLRAEPAQAYPRAAAGNVGDAGDVDDARVRDLNFRRVIENRLTID